MTKLIDLDADLDLEEVEEASIAVKLFGTEFRVLVGLNSYSVSRLVSGDPGALSAFIDQMIHEDDRAEFRRVLAEQKSLKNPENLNKVFTKLIEVASEGVPTNRPSASSRTASKRTSTPRSAPASSTRRAAASATRR